MTIEERAEAKNISDRIRDQFGKGSLNADEFAKYLGKSRSTVYEGIRNRRYPGQCDGRSYTIPVESIALWEIRLSKTKEKESDY